MIWNYLDWNSWPERLQKESSHRNNIVSGCQERIVVKLQTFCFQECRTCNDRNFGQIFALLITMCYINNPPEVPELLYWKSPKPSSCEFSKMWAHAWFQQRTRTCVISVRHEWHCCLPSISYWWPSFTPTTSHTSPFSSQQLFFACSRGASPCMPAVVLHVLFRVLYFTFKMFYFLCLYFYVLLVWKVL